MHNHKENLKISRLYTSQNGFTVIEAMLILVILGILGFTGWFVLNAKKNTDKSLNSNSSTAPVPKIKQKTADTDQVSLKEYKNLDYGFSFEYPSTWKLKEDLGDVGRGTPEGTVTVTSPLGTVIHFDPNLGGKGGDCIDDEAGGQRTTRLCTTVETLKLTPFASGIADRTFYLYERKVIPSTEYGGQPMYEIGVSDNKFGVPALGSVLTPVAVDIISTIHGNINIQYSGNDDAKGDSAAFFDTSEVGEVSKVLRTLKLTSQ